MIIADTSIWIEFLRAHEPCVERMATLLDRGEVLGAPWIFGELLQGARDVRELTFLQRLWRALPKPELSMCEGVWIRAGIESPRGRWHSRGVGLIDAAIACLALEMGCKVWSLDSRLVEILRFKRILYRGN